MQEEISQFNEFKLENPHQKTVNIKGSVITTLKKKKNLSSLNLKTNEQKPRYSRSRSMGTRK